MADIPSIERSLIYNKGTDAALSVAENNPSFGTHDLVKAVIDAVWADIKAARDGA
jgi:hypothetical protein